MTFSIPQERIRQLNSRPTREGGRYVLYAMQAAQRVDDNPALALAAARANELGQPLLVAFCLMVDFPEASLRHYTFMLEGLADTFDQLRVLSAKPVLVQGDWAEEMAKLSVGASEMILDQGYLRMHKAAYAELARTVDCRLFQVEGEAVVPVEVASTKAEHAARTIRPRIHRHLGDFLRRVKVPEVQTPPSDLAFESLDGGLSDLPKFLSGYSISDRAGPTRFFRGGPTEAVRHLRVFLDQRLTRYDEMRNQPQTDYTSCMSLFLHYGMISPVHLALSVLEQAGQSDPQAESYVEELVVRRGLSQNFCHFTADYDRWSCLPGWARLTLGEHADDVRQPLYTKEQLEAAQTHDPYWNAAQVEMVETGYMHNYMRMYWGKKILEWSESPEIAYQTTLALNNRYFLDGRDPVSFANVAWIFGLHDRAWQERAIFGKIRCMMASGLERKNDPKAYVKKVQRMTGRKVLGQTSQGELF
jgi:deoxyribodipyrimidine photo-lyase